MHSFRCTSALFVGALGISASYLHAGEFNLTVRDSVSDPCEHPVEWSVNTCTSHAVINDLNEHYLAGKPFRLAAITPSMSAGRVSFASSRERTAVCSRLAELLASSSVHEAAMLERTVIALNYSTMFKALEAVRSRPSLTPEAKARVERAFLQHPRSPSQARQP